MISITTPPWLCKVNQFHPDGTILPTCLAEGCSRSRHRDAATDALGFHFHPGPCQLHHVFGLKMRLKEESPAVRHWCDILVLFSSEENVLL